MRESRKKRIWKQRWDFTSIRNCLSLAFRTVIIPTQSVSLALRTVIIPAQSVSELTNLTQLTEMILAVELLDPRESPTISRPFVHYTWAGTCNEWSSFTNHVSLLPFSSQLNLNLIPKLTCDSSPLLTYHSCDGVQYIINCFPRGWSRSRWGEVTTSGQ